MECKLNRLVPFDVGRCNLAVGNGSIAISTIGKGSLFSDFRSLADIFVVVADGEVGRRQRAVVWPISFGQLKHIIQSLLAQIVNNREYNNNDRRWTIINVVTVSTTIQSKIGRYDNNIHNNCTMIRRDHCSLFPYSHHDGVWDSRLSLGHIV
jgi:hypothetical protein